MAWAATRRASGATIAELASELGVHASTVTRWRTGQTSGRALVPVDVVPDREAVRALTVVSPSGFRVEGLSLIEAAALLRAVG